MAAFEEDYTQLDWMLFQNGWIVLYEKHEVLARDIDWLAAHGYGFHRFDCARRSSKQDALQSLGTSLRFPDYYGESLDAFDDCLGGIQVPLEGGTILPSRATTPSRSASRGHHRS